MAEAGSGWQFEVLLKEGGDKLREVVAVGRRAVQALGENST